MTNNIILKYARSKGKEAKSFIRFDKDQVDGDLTLWTMDGKGEWEMIDTSYKEIVNWIMENIPPCEN